MFAFEYQIEVRDLASLRDTALEAGYHGNQTIHHLRKKEERKREEKERNDK